jgi:uncharacterized protein involved in exopolysaccharide biosynthesis
MPESFEMLRFLEHLRRRWRVVVVACGVAVLVALVAAWLTPARYTATATIMIEPPAGGDVRFAMTVSPIYLEMLKSYEVMASGDGLFLDAVEHFHLKDNQPIDKLKRSVLRVRIPRNTKILEISATLRDARMAQALALYVAQQMVKLTRQVSVETERDLIAEAQKQVDEAGARLDAAERAWAQAAEQPITSAPDRSARIGVAQEQRDTARASFEAAQKQLQEARANSGTRGERLRIVDPGVVPERPSWPNIPLIVIAAVLVALAGSLFYLALEFSYRLERAAAPRPVAPLARVKSLND